MSEASHIEGLFPMWAKHAVGIQANKGDLSVPYIVKNKTVFTTKKLVVAFFDQSNYKNHNKDKDNNFKAI